MTSSTLIPVLFVVTLGAVIVFAFISKKRTQRKMADENASKSTLAEDAPNQR